MLYDRPYALLRVFCLLFLYGLGPFNGDCVAGELPLPPNPTLAQEVAAIAQATLHLMAINRRHDLPRVISLAEFESPTGARVGDRFYSIAEVASVLSHYRSNTQEPEDSLVPGAMPDPAKRREILDLVVRLVENVTRSQPIPSGLLLMFSDELWHFANDAEFQGQRWQIFRNREGSRPEVPEIFLKEINQFWIASFYVTGLAAKSATNAEDYKKVLRHYLARPDKRLAYAVITWRADKTEKYIIEDRGISFAQVFLEILQENRIIGLEKSAYSGASDNAVTNLGPHLFAATYDIPPTRLELEKIRDEVIHRLQVYQETYPMNFFRDLRRQLRKLYVDIEIPLTSSAARRCSLKLVRGLGIPNSRLLDLTSSWPLKK